MKCLIVSDIHGNSDLLRRLLRLHHDADVVFFLGDGINEVYSVAEFDNEHTWRCVRGNCDGLAVFKGQHVPRLDCVQFFGRRISFTHGDMYGAKYSLDGLLDLAKNSESDVVLFGHTHIPLEKYVDGIYLFNPGSLCSDYEGKHHYGLMMIDDKNILFSHGEI